MATSLIALGSNLGDSTTILQRAIDELNRSPDVAVAQSSRWFRTAPVGGPPGQGEFINAAVRVETSLTAERLHDRLGDVETRLGRHRRQRWAARLVDLDLLLFDELVLQTARLTIPHPRMAFRRFVLEPAAEVAGGMRHPQIGWTVQQLLDHLNRSAEYLALTGVPGIGKTQLARRVARAASLRLIEDPAHCELAAQAGRTAGPDRDFQEANIVSRRAAPLAAAKWPSEAGVVSDFWIGQSLVYARLRGIQEPGDMQRLGQMASDGVVPPKLLAWLAGPAADVRRMPTPDRAATPRPEEAMWEEIVAQHYRGPVLRLDAGEPDWALAELAAAMQAMR